LAFGTVKTYNHGESSIILSLGSFIAMFTDGTFEARGNGELFADMQLLQVIEESPNASAQQILGRIVSACFEFSEGKLACDIAIPIIKRS
jgi:serine phosphatase RsbU (regulator of sigma subunit)